MSDADWIVCDTGPLIALSSVGRLDLLPQLFSRLVAPRAVIDELRAGGEDRPGARTIAESGWLEIVEKVRAERLLAAELGPGEAATFALVSELGAPLVLLDDRRARRIAAQAYGLRIKGSAGVLVAARRAGLIGAVRPFLEAMVASGYYLSARLIDRACAAAGESSGASDRR